MPTMNDVETWLRSIGLAQYASTFAANDIDLEVLSELTEQDLMGLGVSLGHRKRLLKAIRAGLLNNRPTIAASSSTSTAVPAPASPRQAERRQLTVMFCDLVGSTALSVRFDPEDLREIITAFRNCCYDVVTRFGGNVASYMGDGLMVYFGYPRADEHDPERAVRAGLELVAYVGGLRVRSELTLRTRVGIATGEVVVGDLIGEGISREHAVVGTTPNLAARLQGLAKPDTVVISERTHRLASGLFDYADLGRHALKGFDTPLPAWEVVGERAVDSRFEATHPKTQLTPLVNCETELELLLSRWSQARAGKGQVVLIEGEPGIGKSRLTQAVREHLDADSYILVRYYGVPYYHGSALFPVINEIERAAGFTGHDSAALKLDKLERLLNPSADNFAEVAWLLASLLSIRAGERYPALVLSPERQKGRTLDALKAQLLDLAHRQPVLLIFEDLHWADPTTMEFMDLLIGGVAGLPILVLITHRPEVRPPWDERPHVTRLVLRRLIPKHGQELVSNLTSGKRLPPEMMDEIVAKTDGVPLFVEELTKTVLESDFLKEEQDRFTLAGPLPRLAVPSTLHGSLMARLDNLGWVKDVAQIGAALGRHFSFELLSAVYAGSGPQLRRALARLSGAGLIHPHGRPPDVTYTFKHALVQEVAHSSMLRSQRRELHGRIARALEQRFPEVPEAEPEVLAQHYAQAGLNLEAIRYGQRAGTRAGERAAYVEAIKHLTAALDLLSGVPDDVTRDQLELGLRVSLGLSLASSRGYATPEVEDTYRRARELCQRLGESAELFPVLRGLSTFYIVRDDLQTARELAEQCLKLAERTKRRDYLIESYTPLSYVSAYMGELDAAQSLLERSLELYESDRKRRYTYLSPQDPGVACLSLSGMVQWLLGYPDRALTCVREAIALAGELEQPLSLAYAHSHAAMLHQRRGESVRAAEHATATVEISSEHGLDVWLAVGNIHQGIAKGALDEPEAGLAMLTGALTAFRAGGAEAFVPYYLAGLAETYSRAARLDEALEAVAQGLEHSARHHDHFYDAALYRLHGELQLAVSSGAQEAAEADFLRSIETSRKQGARSLELQATISLHKLYRRQHRGAVSLALLATLYGEFKEGLDTLDLQEATGLLSERA